jgi:hypothetical protein
MMTPVTASTGRRDAIDVARVLALAVVVFGHLTLAVIDRESGGAVRGTNLLLLYPRWSVLAMAAPMPVFFAAGGWANATTEPRRAADRLRALVGLALVVVGCWSVAVVVAVALRGGDPGVLGRGARLATQPLWFLAAYLPFAFWGRALARLAVRRPLLSIGGCVALTGVIDVGHFGLSGPGWLAWPAFYLAWVTPWLLGAWWRDRWTRGAFPERRVGIAVAIGAGIVAWILVARAGYQASLIDYGSEGRSNTNPPTFFTAVIGVAQFGVLLVVARGLDWLGAQFRRVWDFAGSVAIAVYAWHLTALSLCVGIVAIPGVPAPERLSPAWWLTRPLWYLAVLAVCAVLVAITATVRARLHARALRRMQSHASQNSSPPAIARLAVGTVVGAVGGAAVGLYGPGTVPRALVCCALLGAGWGLLRSPTRV